MSLTCTKDYQELLEQFQQQINLLRLPVLEPDVFDGNILSYIPWKSKFSIIILDKPYTAAEKVSYLMKYVCSDIRKLVNWYVILPADEALKEILEFLDERYGDLMCIAHAYRQKLESWPNISENDGPALRKFSDFLLECNVCSHAIDI